MFYELLVAEIRWFCNDSKKECFAIFMQNNLITKAAVHILLAIDFFIFVVLRNLQIILLRKRNHTELFFLFLRFRGSDCKVITPQHHVTFYKDLQFE